MRSPLPKTTKPAVSAPILLALGTVAALGAAALWNRSKTIEAERDAPPQGKFIEVDGVRLHYLERGDGPPLVLLHGNGTTAQDFASSGLIDEAAQRFRVFAFDRPGFGYSDRPRTTIWSPTAQADLIMAALSRLGIDRPIIVGHSWGCLVTTAAALNYPNDIRGIVLLSGYYFPTLRLGDPLMGVPAIPIIGDVIRWTISPLLGKALLGQIYRKLFAPSAVPSYFAEDFRPGLALRPSQIRASAADTALMVQGAKTLFRRYGELSMPVAIVAGSGDEIVIPEQQSERLHRVVWHSTYTTVPDAGHMIHHIVPSAVMDAIDSVVNAEAKILDETLDDLDDALADSFPASDPPSQTTPIEASAPVKLDDLKAS